MRPLTLLLPNALAGVVCLAIAIPGFAYDGQALEKDAKVKMDRAKADALKAYPGKITKEELEKENGGSGLRYSFVISGSKGVREVGIDAQTGRVLENANEGPHPD